MTPIRGKKTLSGFVIVTSRPPIVRISGWTGMRETIPADGRGLSISHHPERRQGRRRSPHRTEIEPMQYLLLIYQAELPAGASAG